ncbi:hypothetical protein GLYMA_18G138600v4 [Glycine max]|uniref:Secreted protein n=1 Tax=Glycine max TaxID=3847 RepID=A0A0R0F862_SOYBN|nr:hypothetical protein JHK84_050198 [Glycine max]KAH1154441.1 hypothetical protein GYH30_049927 [Glycine max]KRG99345.1 hypothetical protein GLYMA_18G138600v4 [Glycine max]
MIFQWPTFLFFSFGFPFVQSRHTLSLSLIHQRVASSSCQFCSSTCADRRIHAGTYYNNNPCSCFVLFLFSKPRFGFPEPVTFPYTLPPFKDGR